MTKNAILTARNELAMESYENLCRQSEEIMMLRHNTMKHYTLLYSMAQKNPEQLPTYLEQLIGQMKEIRPVVQSRNQMLDIIINGKLGIAADKGITVEIIRSKAPEKLPLTNTQLCSLITNILDNAIDYACSSESEKPYIKLDFHCKNNNFIFSCENTMNPDKCQIEQSTKNRTYERQQKIPMPKHGYGLKIIRRIIKNFNDMISIETNGNIFKTLFILYNNLNYKLFPYFIKFFDKCDMIFLKFLKYSILFQYQQKRLAVCNATSLFFLLSIIKNFTFRSERKYMTFRY